LAGADFVIREKYNYYYEMQKDVFSDSRLSLLMLICCAGKVPSMRW
jgi:hypothetical protein